MKRLIKANPMAFALVLVFLLLILIGVMTTKGVESTAQPAPRAGVSLAAPAQPGSLA
jgi:hypothetical protein